jgi:hypothetical protein
MAVIKRAWTNLICGKIEWNCFAARPTGTMFLDIETLKFRTCKLNSWKFSENNLYGYKLIPRKYRREIHLQRNVTHQAWRPFHLLAGREIKMQINKTPSMCHDALFNSDVDDNPRRYCCVCTYYINYSAECRRCERARRALAAYILEATHNTSADLF